MKYYENFKIRVTSKRSYSNWYFIEKGIITGCTISAILFNVAMSLLEKSAEKD